ncbi:DNA-binding transcriptional LysR family regulator [Pelomonas saccharophila]|uniref:DNA-binding transcriptional LysR family regulator n=1 Tax=Roseateles saccharophilus TaxID=304 RepID=A0ABU1YT78_ROSSA|nr:LysR family transcriptional regulator [Roseateles saccharophilus]MDR7272067.1 DNA-binding transcriptional LysR family regulator [Roseateles saccharophilus]
MELRHLRYFVTVAETGHMTRAAGLLGMQQPPLSQQIKALEQELGLVLLHRHPKGVSLTDGGRQFLGEAKRLLRDFGDMRDRMERLAGGQYGLLTVGFTSSAAAHAFTPAVLRACRSEQPGIALTMTEDNAAGLIDAIAKSRLHCGFLRVPVAQPEGISFETLLTEPALLALPLDHRLAAVPRASTTPVPLAELENEDLILVRKPGAPGLYANLLALCERHGVRPRSFIEVDRMMMNMNLVAAGAGISVVPASMRGMHAHSIVCRPLEKHAQLEAPLTLAFRGQDQQGPTATFIALARRIAQECRAA